MDFWSLTTEIGSTEFPEGKVFGLIESNMLIDAFVDTFIDTLDIRINKQFVKDVCVHIWNTLSDIHPNADIDSVLFAICSLLTCDQWQKKGS